MGACEARGAWCVRAAPRKGGGPCAFRAAGVVSKGGPARPERRSSPRLVRLADSTSDAPVELHLRALAALGSELLNRLDGVVVPVQLHELVRHLPHGNVALGLASLHRL